MNISLPLRCCRALGRESPPGEIKGCPCTDLSRSGSPSSQWAEATVTKIPTNAPLLNHQTQRATDLRQRYIFVMKLVEILEGGTNINKRGLRFPKRNIYCVLCYCLPIATINSHLFQVQFRFICESFTITIIAIYVFCKFSFAINEVTQLTQRIVKL